MSTSFVSLMLFNIYKDKLYYNEVILNKIDIKNILFIILMWWINFLFTKKWIQIKFMIYQRGEKKKKLG